MHGQPHIRIYLLTVCIIAYRYGLYPLYRVRLKHLSTSCNVVIWCTLLQYVLVQTHRIALYTRNAFMYFPNHKISVSVLTFSWLILYLLLVHNTSHDV